MKSRVSGKALNGCRQRGTVRKDSPTPATSDDFRFRRLFETAKDGILILDGKKHTVLEVNPYLAALLGMHPKEILGRKLSDLGILADRTMARGVFEQLRKGGTAQFTQHIDARNERPSTEVEFVCNSYEEKGRPLIQCNIRDVAHRTEVERQLREALQQLAAAKQQLELRVQERTADLEQRNAELEAFSYSLSHDLRAPIRAIVSFTQLALEEFGDRIGPPATVYLQKAVTAAQRLDRLVVDVLSFSRTTRQSLVPETIDVEQLLNSILEDRPEWQAPMAKILVDKPLARIIGDRASLTQCLTNLLDNAVKFVPQGITPTIRIYTRRFPNRIRLCVSDNGIGIPPAAQARVFDLFQRAHNGYEGYGIGLAIVRRAADRMRGSVTVTSEAGKGSTFCLDLPAQPAHPELLAA